MTARPLDKKTLKAEYDQVRAKYDKLEASLTRDLQISLDEAGISVLSIESRIKKYDSFWDKVQRKGCDDPLEEIQDICGIRVICYYPSGVEPVCTLIKDSLDVIEYVDKAESQKPEEFGYLSRHFIVTPREHWLRTPSYDGLDGLTAEIQVRTVFQHAWAELSQELAYKKKEHVPRIFQRRLSQLSAMLENLDAQFDALRLEKAEYARSVSDEARGSGRFDVDQDLNIDTLQAFLDFHFPDRESELVHKTELLEDLRRFGISLGELQHAFERVEHLLPQAEEQVFSEVFKDHTFYGREWGQVGIARAILELTNDDFWLWRATVLRDRYVEVMAEWRESLSQQDA